MEEQIAEEAANQEVSTELQPDGQQQLPGQTQQPLPDDDDDEDGNDINTKVKELF
jgi:hypothetical protein